MLFERLEIMLWNMVIYLMSESHPIQVFVQESYFFVERKTRMRTLIQVFFWAGLGLFLGFLLGLLNALFG
jgi:hypothetical protein